MGGRKKVHMRTTRIIAVAVLIAVSGVALHLARAQQGGIRAGEVLFIPGGAVHAVKNVGTGNAAELATYIVEKGEPLVVPVK